MSVIVRIPELVPAVVGVNVRLIMQVLDGANGEPHVELAATNGPVVVILATLSGAVPVLVIVRGWAELVVPTG